MVFVTGFRRAGSDSKSCLLSLAGAFGTVRLARSRQTGEMVAIKVPSGCIYV